MRETIANMELTLETVDIDRWICPEVDEDPNRAIILESWDVTTREATNAITIMTVSELDELIAVLQAEREFLAQASTKEQPC